MCWAVVGFPLAFTESSSTGTWFPFCPDIEDDVLRLVRPNVCVPSMASTAWPVERAGVAEGERCLECQLLGDVRENERPATTGAKAVFLVVNA